MMSDCMEINKDEVIKRLRDMTKAYAATGNHSFATLFRDAADLIEQKSALYERALSDVVRLSVERKTANWKDDYDGGWSTCSECNESFLWEDNSGVAAWNYCPSCGAKVIKEDIPMEYFESGGK